MKNGAGGEGAAGDSSRGSSEGADAAAGGRCHSDAEEEGKNAPTRHRTCREVDRWRAEVGQGEVGSSEAEDREGGHEDVACWKRTIWPS